MVILSMNCWNGRLVCRHPTSLRYAQQETEQQDYFFPLGSESSAAEQRDMSGQTPRLFYNHRGSLERVHLELDSQEVRCFRK